MPEKPGLMMYWEMFDVLESLLDGQAKTMLHAIRNYSQYGQIPTFDADSILSTLWMLVKPKIDADNERYARIIDKRRQAGKASAAKRHSESNTCQHMLTSVDMCQHPSTHVNRCQPTTTTTATTTATTTSTVESIKGVPGGNPDDPRRVFMERVSALTDSRKV